MATQVSLCLQWEEHINIHPVSEVRSAHSGAAQPTTSEASLNIRRQVSQEA